MIILDATTKSLEVKLGGTVTANQLPFTAAWADHTTSALTPGHTDGVSNNTTAVTLVAAPASSTQRQIKSFSIFNDDTTGTTVIVQYNNNATIRQLIEIAVPANATLIYSDGRFTVINSSGEILSGVDGNLVHDNTSETVTGLWAFEADITLKDNVKLTLGTGGDVDLYYDGTDLILNTQVVGSGDFKIQGGRLRVEGIDGLAIRPSTGRDSYLTPSDNSAAIYLTGSGGSYPFNAFGHLIIQPRIDSGQLRNVIIATGVTPTRALTIDSVGDIYIEQTKKLFLDGGGDTYIWEISANLFQIVTNGTAGFMMNSAQYVSLKVSGRLYFDGLVDTYIYQLSDNLIRVVVGGTQQLSIETAAVKVLAGDFHIPSNKKLFLDGGGNTYIIEPSADILEFYTGGTRRMKIFASGTIDVYGSFRLTATQRLYLDSGDNTYITEAAADIIHIYVGGAKVGHFAAATVRFQQAYDVTTGTAANLFVNTDGSLRRSTSSLRYKADIQGIDITEARRVVMGLQGITYISKCVDDCNDNRYAGFVAEEVHQIIPTLVQYDSNKRPEGFNYGRTEAYIVPVLQDHERTISDLLDRIQVLEG